MPHDPVPTNGIFPGEAPLPTGTTPGYAALGFVGALGFSPPVTAGVPLGEFFVFLPHFNQLAADGINPALVTGWVQALEFDPVAVSEPASLHLRIGASSESDHQTLVNSADSA